jgi:4-amino-4-deoxy-L-arabinose transferase-like glycosyltransferase
MITVIRKHPYWTPVIILLIATLLRFNGLGYGLPYVLHPDEHQYVNAAIACLSDSQMCISQLERYNNPPLFKVILTAFFALISYLTAPTAQFPGTTVSTSWHHYYWYLGRFASAAAGVLSVAIVYVLAKRLYVRKMVANLAAFSLAVCFLHVRESHAAVNDALLSLMVLLVLCSATLLLRHGHFSNYVFTGVTIGAAAATKYTGIFAVQTLLLAHLLYTYAHRLSWRHRIFAVKLYVGLIMIPLTFLVLTPLIVVSWEEMLRRISGLAEYGRSGYHHYLLDAYGGWFFYLKVLGWGVGWLILPILIWAICSSLVQRKPQDLLLSAPSVIYYATMASQQMFFARFILPIVPPLLVLTSAWLVRRLESSNCLLRNKIGLTAIAIVLLSQSWVTSLWFGILLNRPDTRILTIEWLAENISQGSAIFFEECVLPEQTVVGKPKWPYVRMAEQEFDHPDRLGYYLERRARYIIIGDFCTEVQFSSPTKEAGRRIWLDKTAQLRLVKEISPYWLAGGWFAFESRLAPAQDTLVRLYAGPTIRIYETSLPAGWHSLNPFESTNQIADVASLYGWEIVDETLSPGNTLNIAIYWQNHRWKPQYQMEVTLIDTNGRRVSQGIAAVAPGFERDLEAKRSRPVKSLADVLIPPEIAPGQYALEVSISDPRVPYVVGRTMLDEALVRIKWSG